MVADRVGAVDPLVVQAAEARAEPHADHPEGREARRRARRAYRGRCTRSGGCRTSWVSTTAMPVQVELAGTCSDAPCWA